MYQPELIRSAIVLLCSHNLPEHLAEDMVQDVFGIMFMKYEELKDRTDVKSWLLKAIRFQVLSESQKAYHSVEVPIHENYDPPGKEILYEDLTSTLLASLSSEDRNILLLHAEAGYKHREIAEKLGISCATCRKRYNRAKKEIKKKLQEYEKSLNPMSHFTCLNKINNRRYKDD